MVLEGVVTKVTKFGAFVDIGVHQDGLVHISELSNRYVKDASEIVKAGQIVKVTVRSADPRTKRLRNMFFASTCLQTRDRKDPTLDVSLAVEICDTLPELQHHNLGIRSQPQRRSPRSRSAGSEKLHPPDPA
jgi:transcriptional accessory protein Tex/SPT6